MVDQQRVFMNSGRVKSATISVQYDGGDEATLRLDPLTIHIKQTRNIQKETDAYGNVISQKPVGPVMVAVTGDLLKKEQDGDRKGSTELVRVPPTSKDADPEVHGDPGSGAGVQQDAVGEHTPKRGPDGSSASAQGVRDDGERSHRVREPISERDQVGGQSDVRSDVPRGHVLDDAYNSGAPRGHLERSDLQERVLRPSSRVLDDENSVVEHLGGRVLDDENSVVEQLGGRRGRVRRGHCPVTGKSVKSVEEIYAYLDGKIKVWLGFPKDWMDDVRRTVAEVLYESAVRRGITRTTELVELVLEGDSSIMMKSSKTMRMASGAEVPIWADGPLEKDALKRMIEDIFNAR